MDSSSTTLIGPRVPLNERKRKQEREALLCRSYHGSC